MSQGVEKQVFYFDKKGPDNTDKTLDIALACCQERGINKIVVASSRGHTALKLHTKASPSVEIIAVTYGAGSRYTDDVAEFNKNYATLVEKKIHIVRGLHTLSGAEKAFENKYKTGFTPLNVVADTLRMFCHGVKVCVEIAVMAAEHGFICPDEEVVVIAGSHHGADTAIVLQAAFAANIFDTKIKRLLCMPA
ncbi:MAG: hypothetical protein JSV83_07475 [Desulfobacterales bacterium]|nr:MAG: hypothetical protein JSV83_07475 [Desulfobacterales bacterium]